LSLTRRERWLLVIFFVSLPLMNPWVRGDGIGYYAFARAPLIEHSLDFQRDYRSGNASFRDARFKENGRPRSFLVTSTGHLDNHFTVGPAILWAPFLLVAHAGVSLARAFGSQVAADGFSAPYRFAMAFGTALYGFLGLLLSARAAREYVDERWAFLATIAIWWGSSLPVYMYFNPSWSHAHSAFAVALFLWYWHKTRNQRTTCQWCVLGVIAGLMLNVYYANVTILVVLVVEAIRQYLTAFRHATAPRIPADTSDVDFADTPKSRRERGRVDMARADESRGTTPLVGDLRGDERFDGAARRDSSLGSSSVAQLLVNHLLFCLIVVVCLLPTFISRYVIYGSALESGYVPLGYWAWRSPYFLSVLFSSDHGLLLWTPVVILAVVGLFVFWRREPRVGAPILAAVLAFYLLIACYPDWDGISSYGNRFFISLTAPFILGLSVLFDRAAAWFHSSRTALAAASSLVACLILWNMAFVFQWGTHLVPARGPIVWSEMIHNQFFAVPREASGMARSYLFHRANLMRQIEQRDIERMDKPPAP
jgi:hypothetical protein